MQMRAHPFAPTVPAPVAAARTTLLVLGSDDRVTNELCAELERTRLAVIRQRLDSPLESASHDPDLVAVVAPSRAVMARVALDVAKVLPRARIIGFLELDDASEETRGELPNVSRVFDLAAVRESPLSTVVHLLLANDAVLARLQSSTVEIEQLVAAGARARTELHEVSQLLRSHASGVLMGLDSLGRSGTASPLDEAVLDSMRASLKSVLLISDRLGSSRY